MKKLILITLCNFFLITVAIAQLDEGHIIFEIEANATNPQMEMAVGMMQGSTMDIYFSKENSHTELNMGTMMKVNTIVLGKSGDVLMLMSGMMGDIATPTTMDALMEKANSTDVPPFDIELTSDTKKIERYKCKKAILTSEDGLEAVFWYTSEIKANTQGQSFHNDKIPGFPLEFSTNSNGLEMSFTAIDVIEGIDNEEKEKLFSIKIPDGYKEMNADDLKKMGM